MSKYLWTRFLCCLAALAASAMLLPTTAQAVPAFARQTGQNCVACHTGGQFPELTPYGRLFKLTGYTIGERANPLSVMGVASIATVADTSKSDTADAGTGTGNSQSDFYKNGEPILATGSLFIAGKISDNIGAFTQITHDPYAVANADGSSSGHTNVDNVDLRYADRRIDDSTDVIWGISVNNNPSVADPWNTAPAWMQYVPGASPGSHQFIDANTPYPSLGAGGNLAGVSAYVYFNQAFYGEVGYYSTADGTTRLLREGIDDSQITRLKGNNPYWRLAYTHAWGASNLMVGAMGMVASIYDGTSSPDDMNAYNRVRNLGLDTQYQYILDPLTVTFQGGYMEQTTQYSANTLANGPSYAFYLADGVTPVAAPNSSDRTQLLRAKLAVTYKARYGASLSYFNLTGTSNTLNQTSGYEAGGSILSAANGGGSTRVTGNLSGKPDTSGTTVEVFYTPLQNLRLGLQYTAYDTFNGASSNYDGLGRNASDNNTVYAYAWFAF